MLLAFIFPGWGGGWWWVFVVVGVLLSLLFCLYVLTGCYTDLIDS